MKRMRILRSTMVLFLLVAALTAVAVGLACAGGEDGSAGTTVTLGPVDGGTSTSGDTGTTNAGGGDYLSSFRAKDPFIPQATLLTTTTRSTTTTIPTTTTTRPPTTTTRWTTTTVTGSTTTSTAAPTTTVPHTLTCQIIWEIRNPVQVNFQVDLLPVLGAIEGTVVTGAFGRIEVTAIDVVSIPNVVTFLRDDLYEYVLGEGEFVTW